MPLFLTRPAPSPWQNLRTDIVPLGGGMWKHTSFSWFFHQAKSNIRLIEAVGALMDVEWPRFGMCPLQYDSSLGIEVLWIPIYYIGNQKAVKARSWSSTEPELYNTLSDAVKTPLFIVEDGELIGIIMPDTLKENYCHHRSAQAMAHRYICWQATMNSGTARAIEQNQYRSVIR